MSSPKDDGRKDPLRQGDPKRPHATLDLKAVEIKNAAAAAGEAKPADAAKAAASPESKAAGAAKTEATASSVKPAAEGASATGGSVPTSGAAGAAAKAAASAETAAAGSGGKDANLTRDGGRDGGKDAGKPAAAPAAAAATAATAARGGSAIGRMFTHLTAGLVGGFIALLGADSLAPQLRELGLPVGLSGASPETGELKTRLAALEKAQQSASSAADADLAEKVAAANARLAKLEGLESKLAAVAEGQGRLQSDAEAMAKKLAGTEGGADAERLARLEQQLQLLSKAAEGSQGSAAIPQLAAVTGRVADLQSTVDNQLASLRKSVSEEIDTRISRAAEAAEAARSGTQRIDRELSDIKSENARIAQRLEAMKSEDARVAETLRVVQEETGKVAAAIEALKGDTTQRFKTVARPDDVAAAVAPVTAKVAALEASVQKVVTAEDNRKANAERIVLSLELANLKRVVDRGLAYSDELEQVKKASAGSVDLGALEKYKSEGVPTLTELQKSFQPLAHAIIEAAAQPADGGVVDRLLAGAKSIVRVRKASHDTNDDSVEAVVARMDKALDEGRIGDFMALRPKLPAAALVPAHGFMQKVEARHAVDKALGEIESQLKTSLGSSASVEPATR